MTKKLSIIKSIFLFAVPILFANLIQSGYQLVDAFWVGKLGPLAVAGITNAGSIMFLMVSLGIGFAIAGGVLTAQYFGAKNQDMVNKTSAQTILASFVLSVLLSIIGISFLKPFFNLINVPKEVLPYSMSFAKVALMGTPFIFSFSMFQSVMRSIGKMKMPIYIGLLSLCLNFLLDPLFIYGYKFIPAMGVSGAAMATIMTESIAAIIGLYILFSGKQGIKLHLKDFVPDFSFIKKTFLLGLPGSFEMGFRSISSVILMFLVNAFGATAIAVYGVGSNVFMLTTMMPSMAFSVAVSILVGHKLGAQQKKEAREVANVGTLLVFLIVTLISFLAFIFAKDLLQFFIPNDASVLRLGIYYIRVVAIAAPFISLQFSAAAILRSSGNMISSMMISLISVWLFQIPFALIASKYLNLGIKGIFISALFSAVLVGISVLFYMRYKKWENKNLIHHKKESEEKVKKDNIKDQISEDVLEKEIEEEIVVETSR